MSKVLDEHFSYLALKGRSTLYNRAIQQEVRPGDVVVDLGCGFGVLGIEALQAGASRVYGIDHSGAIDIAREAVERLGLSDRYICIADSTFRADLPEQVDVILCDHVGYIGIDYGIVRMIDDARHRMLKPGGRVIPRSIDLMLAGVSSDRLRTQANAWLQDPIPDYYQWLHEYQVNSKIALSLMADEVLIPPQKLGTIDLTTDSPDSFTFKATLTAAQAGRFDGLGGWFDCELAPGVRMTNSPLDEAAIDRPRVFLPVREAFDVAAGDDIGVTLTIRHDRTMLAWTVTPPGGGKRQKMSTWNSEILSPADRTLPSEEPLVLSPLGLARRLVLELVDGARSQQDIVAAVTTAYPALFPSHDEIIRFVQRELASATR